MKKAPYRVLCAAAAIFGLSSAPGFAQSTYSGNGATGFGGQLGNSSLNVSDSGGNITFSLTSTGIGDYVAFYIDAGGTSTNGVNTSTGIADNGTESYTTATSRDAGRISISADSATGTQATVNFPTGFYANYAASIAGTSGSGSYYGVVPSGLLNYIGSANEVVTAGTNTSSYVFTLSDSQLGLAVGSKFSFVAFLSNANSDSNGDGTYYGSNESIGAGTINTTSNPGANPNIGTTGIYNFSSSDSYTLSGVPEPSAWVVTSAGAALLAFSFFRRRLRA